MNLVTLMLALQSFLQSRLSEEGALVPAVYIGDAPGEETARPVLLIRPHKGHSDEEEATARIRLEISSDAPGEAGYADMMNLLERVRVLLLRERTLERRFRLDANWKWSVHRRRSDSRWVARVTTSWTYPQIRQEAAIHE
ncbi:hypothetical protein F4V43_11260 [Paenibacillus spiritus]|uniref:DUF3168 domain-containing protein n=1 Tax=Paenibacillus spiritus TaxID=2496557 RepID=A0A5J5G8W6_9BACL|nr:MULTISPECIES: hypothetical protein [Paenibacillus]KAA9003984.1 hypothetical protein F4V43_11260 [Paenibacillus spiritus]